MSTNHGTRTLVLYSYSTHGMQLMRRGAERWLTTVKDGVR